MSPEERVRSVLMAVLPEGVPPSFKSISGAALVEGGRQKRTRADLVMFDDKRAMVEVWQYGPGAWAHKYTYMAGGPCAWDGAQWVRCGGREAA